jgi:hypothetical protein
VISLGGGGFPSLPLGAVGGILIALIIIVAIIMIVKAIFDR